MADLPFMSYATIEDALRNSARLMRDGRAECVKLELRMAQTSLVAALSANGIPVCAHFGLTPQTVHKLGGFRVQGRSRAQASELVGQARALEEAGADLLLVECVPGEVGRSITEGGRHSGRRHRCRRGYRRSDPGPVRRTGGERGEAPEVRQGLSGGHREREGSSAGLCGGGEERGLSGTRTHIPVAMEGRNGRRPPFQLHLSGCQTLLGV